VIPSAGVAPDATWYDLALFVSGASDLSAKAIADARGLCDTHLSGRSHLSVIDVRDDPAAVLSSQVLATPTIVRRMPVPVRKLVGDLSDPDKVLQALGIPAAARTADDRG
jgi:circadian clock protein KaiB